MKQTLIFLSFFASSIACLIGGFIYGFFKGNEYTRNAEKIEREEALGINVPKN